MPSFDEWLEERRLASLKQDTENFNEYIERQYPPPRLKRFQEEARARKQDHDNHALRIVGFTLAAIVAALIFADGFLSGVIFVSAIVIGGFAFHNHSSNAPVFDDETGHLTEEEKVRRWELRRRHADPDYDRQRWLVENEYDRARFERENAPQLWRIRPIEEDDESEPAFILTLRKRIKPSQSDFERMEDRDRFFWMERDGLFWVRIEKRNPDGVVEIVEDRKWEGWPVSWSRDQVEYLALEHGYRAFGRDEYVMDDEG